MQRARRTNPYPFTWEIPLAVVVAVVLVLVLGLHAGRSLANLFAGAGLVFTPRPALFTALPGILRGDAAAGLPAAVTSAGVVSAAALRTWIVVVEVAAVAGMGWAGRAALARWGPWRMQGMASPGEAERLLGLTRLRQVAAVVRPDLYGRGTAR